MSIDKYAQLAVAMDIANDRREQLSAELVAIRTHIRRIEKEIEREQKYEKERAGLLVLNTQRKLSFENKPATLRDAVLAAIKLAQPRDQKSIELEFRNELAAKQFIKTPVPIPENKTSNMAPSPKSEPEDDKEAEPKTTEPAMEPAKSKDDDK